MAAREPGKPRCDICLSPHIDYDWFTKKFRLEPDGLTPGYQDDGEWALCALCSTLSEGKNLPMLIKRALEGQIKWEQMDRKYVYELSSIHWTDRVISGFLDNIERGPLPSRELWN